LIFTLLKDKLKY